MKRFTILGFSANQETFCGECLRKATGLAPDAFDYNGRPVLPLYAGDTTVHEECCTYCGRGLVDLALQRQADQRARFERARSETSWGPRLLRPVPPPIIRRRAALVSDA